METRADKKRNTQRGNRNAMGAQNWPRGDTENVAQNGLTYPRLNLNLNWNWN